MPVSRKCPGYPMCLKTFYSGQGWKAHVSHCHIASQYLVEESRTEDILEAQKKREVKEMTMEERIEQWRSGKYNTDVKHGYDDNSSRNYDSYYYHDNANHGRQGENKAKEKPKPRYGRVSAMVRLHKDPRKGNITMARQEVASYREEEGEFKRI